MPAVQNFKVTVGGATAETDTGLTLGSLLSSKSVLHACLDGTTGSIVVKHVFEDGTEKDIQTVALADGVLGLIQLNYKVPNAKIYYVTAGAGTLRLDTTFSK
jgi:hypothetical protein|tara:strand:- start:772 stop:1077 length:306 start_codon:yes stop_codon:yes gene_type:complete